jgi:voltage-gated potassium channel
MYPCSVLRRIWAPFDRLLERQATRYDALRRDLERQVALNRWFPHVPIGLALVPLGLTLSYRAALSMLGMSASAVRLDELAENLLGAHLGGLSDFVIGGLLIVTAFGLILRARMAWWLAVLSLITSLALRLFTETDGDTHGLVMTYRVTLLLALLLSRHRFPARSLPAQAAMGIYFVVMFLGCATVLTLRRGSHFEPEIHDSVTALYFVIMTISTVGFGDITPLDSQTRGFVLSMIVIGVLVLGSAISVFLLPLISNRLRLFLGNQEDLVNRTRHFIVMGTSSLARNTVLELEKRGQTVTIVLGGANEDPFYQKRDVVVGDATDLEVLKAAGTEKARGVLALSPDDPTNGFVVLGVNELDPTIPTVAALNDPKNQSRLERTQPSILLSLQVLGGQLLAMALTGERVDENFLDSVLEIQPDPATKVDHVKQ